MNIYMIELTVANLATALAWYRDRFLFPVTKLDEAGRFAMLDAGTAKLALKEGSPQPGTTKLVLQTPDLEAALAKLATQGTVADGPIEQHAEGYRQAFIRDTDGHQIALFEWA